MMKQTRLALVLAGALGAAALASTASAAAPHEPASRITPNVNCYWSPSPNGDVSAYFTGQGVNIHTGDSTSCTVVGDGYEGQSLTARCSVFLSNTVQWVYVTDRSTGVTGWVLDNYMYYGPPIPTC